ncbi:MAG: hypothetical protein ACKVI4_14950 [Actinomycetales bacterium]
MSTKRAAPSPMHPPMVQTRSASELAESWLDAAPPPPPKRACVPAGDADHVLLLPTDDPFRPVLVDRKLLRDFDCATGAMLEHQPCERWIEDRPAWPTYMTRAMLLAFMRALRCGTFCQPRGVEEHEVASTFEYEGVAIPGNAIENSSVKVTLAVPGIGLSTRHEQRMLVAENHVKQVVHAIMSWGRLEHGLDVASRGGDPGFTCTRNRVWIGLMPKPTLPRSTGDGVHWLATRRPHWLRHQLEAFGLVHYSIAQAKKIDDEQRDEAAFIALSRAIEADATSYYIGCKRDWPRELRLDQANSEAAEHSRNFAVWVMSAVVRQGPWNGEPSVELPVPVQYARVCITVAEQMTFDMPDVQRVLGGQCVASGMCASAGKGKDRAAELTFERRVFDDACKAAGVRVLEWRDQKPTQIAPGLTPLMFPPIWSQLPCRNECCLCVLLERKDER